MEPIQPIGKSFPNLNERIASYDPASQFVLFETFTREKYNAILDDPLKVENVEGFGVVMHEFRHAFDHMATLWGQHNLLKLQKALSAKLSRNEHEFHHMVTYKKEENQLFHVEYYSETYNVAEYTGEDTRWKYSTSIGMRFDSDGRIDTSKPIVFAKFSSHDDKPLIRVPITVAALLETNAMYEEVTFILNAFMHNHKDDFAFYERPYTKKLFKDLIYNQDLAVYNVAVHVTANTLAIGDFARAFRISSAIATIALNMPAKLAVGLPIPDSFGKEEKARANVLLKNNDRGFIFYLLCINYKNAYKGGDFDLASCLDSNLLPDEQGFMLALSDEFLRIQHEMSKQNKFYKRFSAYNNLGYHLLVKGGIDCMKESILTAFRAVGYIPPTAYSGGEGIDTYNNPLQKLAPNDEVVENDSLWFNVVYDLNVKMKEFYEVRGL